MNQKVKQKEDNKKKLFQAQALGLVSAPEYLGCWHEASEGLFEDF